MRILLYELVQHLQKEYIMKNLVFPMTVLTASLFVVGCGVSKKQYAGLQSDYSKLQTEHSQLT
ncbi:MAG TPA: hypothetical protein DCO90_15290, partial [Sphingobacterium sp.]|nr:hypothetical protein [Sphingobacterium sp.]